MKGKKYFYQLILILFIPFALTLICIAEIPNTELESICFRHRVRDTIKRGCYRMKGKHDAIPRIECPDTSGKLMPFDPGNEWELMDANDPECKPDPNNRPPVPRGDSPPTSKRIKQYHILLGYRTKTLR